MSSLLWNRNSRTSHRCSSFSRLSGFWRDYSQTACPSDNLCALQEIAHFGASASVAFPASEIQNMEWPENRPVEVTTNFMGLTGALGYLPYWYSNLTAERVRSADATLHDFLRIFDHRFISLFYQAWERYRF